MSKNQFTVKELIVKLHCYNENSKVWLDYEGVRMEITEVGQEEILSDDDVVIS